MSKYIVEFESVSYHYSNDSQLALSNLQLRIPTGKRTVILGHNGCGKSTIFLHANGLYRPQQGQVLWKGKPLSYKKKDLITLRKSVGLLFQDAKQQLLAPIVFDDIAYGLRNLGVKEAHVRVRVEQALAQFSLHSIANRPIHYLSEGQKRRVALAGVMVLEPELLLLDEPTSFLDPKQTRALIAELNDIHKKGTTIVMATHDIDLAYRWADWAVVIENGAVVLEGTADEVFQNKQQLTQLSIEVPFSYEVKEVLKKHLNDDELHKSRNHQILLEKLASLLRGSS